MNALNDVLQIGQRKQTLVLRLTGSWVSSGWVRRVGWGGSFVAREWSSSPVTGVGLGCRRSRELGWVGTSPEQGVGMGWVVAGVGGWVGLGFAGAGVGLETWNIYNEQRGSVFLCFNYNIYIFFF
jgi:hypothetical protein